MMKQSNTQGGLSLIEMIIAMSVISLFAVTIMSSTLLNRRLAEANVYQNTAMTVAQGYMEQIKSMEYEVILECLDDPDIALPTKSISALLEGQIEEEDPLMLNQTNDKEVLIDVRDIDTDHARPLTMRYKITPKINDLDTGANPVQALEVTLFYEYESPETGARKWKEGSVRFVKSFVPTF